MLGVCTSEKGSYSGFQWYVLASLNLVNLTDPRIGLAHTNSHNTRSARRTFRIPHAGIMHGLAGYFEACLYGDVGLSIHPQRKDDISPNMLSWFPIFFPFKVSWALPIHLVVS